MLHHQPRGRTILAGLALFFGLCGPLPSAAQQRILGWNEYARIFPENTLMIAKLDTGTQESSLAVSEASPFVRAKEKWVSFVVRDTKGASIRMERKIARTAYLTRRGGKVESRMLVKLGICVGPVFKNLEVALDDRSKYDYDLLLGRSFLGDRILVSSASAETAGTECGAALRRVLKTESITVKGDTREEAPEGAPEK
jgi:hypothetical protein